LDFTGRVHKMTSPEKLESTDVVFYQGMPLRKGTNIVHDRFGRGRIVDILGADADARIQVEFETAGTKTLLLKFSKIRVE
jgi:DNA helicase-2/ATP-dependent DNA helicase PcrA